MYNSIYLYRIIALIGKYVELKSLAPGLISIREFSRPTQSRSVFNHVHSGFLLLEVLIGLMMLTGMAGIIALYHMNIIQQQRHARMQSIALTEADERMELSMHSQMPIHQDTATLKTEIITPHLCHKETWLSNVVVCQQHTVTVAWQSQRGEQQVKFVSVQEKA